MRKSITLLLTLALLFTLTTAYAQSGTDFPTLADFSAATLDGKTFTNEDLAAKDLTMLNIWTTTCGPCITEMPHLAEFAKALPENVQLVTLCLDGTRVSEALTNFLDGIGFEAVTLIGGDNDLLKLASAVRYTPTTLFLNSRGEVVGEPVIGAPRDVESTYLAGINAALAQEGKPVITLEKAQ